MKNRKINFIKLGVFLFGISLLLWNCETDSETIEHIQEKTDFTLKPKIETFSLNQLNKDDKFKELKNTYRILQNSTLAKSTKTNSLSARLIDTLGITIDANSIKRISYNNYVSYTMLMIEAEDTSNNFSNLVIQEYNGDKRIFTVRYFSNQSNSKKSSYNAKTSSRSSIEEIEMRSGINSYTEPWGDPDGSSGNGGNDLGICEEYETVCNTVNVWSSLCSCKGHYPEEYCTCTGPRIDFVQTIEECEDICIIDGYNDQTGNGSNNSNGGAGGSTSTGNNSNPTNVSTTPINPDGSSTVEQMLNNSLEENPFLLLDIDCNQIQNWQSLAQHTPPQSVKDKIKDLKENHEALLGDWDIQYLNDAGGTIVNMDYFGVNITTLPNNPSNGQQFTPQQFLDYFRRNINDFVDGTTFSPYCEISAICSQETNLWNSTNPLGSIVKLDIPINDGVVVCAEYTNDYWRFMTMEAPYDNSHPVSGTRQFGIEQNTNGSYNIYVRGVDRFQSNLQENAAYAIRLGNPFFDADNLWKSFQEKTKNFINQNNGVSSKISPIHNRPDWDKVKNVLEGKRPISDLGCN